LRKKKLSNWREQHDLGGTQDKMHQGKRRTNETSSKTGLVYRQTGRIDVRGGGEDGGGDWGTSAGRGKGILAEKGGVTPSLELLMRLQQQGGRSPGEAIRTKIIGSATVSRNLVRMTTPREKAPERPGGLSAICQLRQGVLLQGGDTQIGHMWRSA